MEPTTPCCYMHWSFRRWIWHAFTC